MKFFQSRRLSDDEFVERTRKFLRKGKRWAWFWLILSGAFIGLMIYFLLFAVDWISSSARDFGRDSKSSESFQAGLLNGYMVGCVITFLLWKAAFYFYEFMALLLGNRRDKLLVAYHDQLHPLDAKAPMPSSVPKY